MPYKGLDVLKAKIRDPVILMMITKTMRETEMIPTTATMLKTVIIERIVMRKTKKRRINMTMRTMM
jgi:hypothetical protein